MAAIGLPGNPIAAMGRSYGAPLERIARNLPGRRLSIAAPTPIRGRGRADPRSVRRPGVARGGAVA